MARPIPVNPELTGIAVAAKTPGMIADQVMSEVPVTSEKFNWNEYPVEQGITAQDTKVGRTSQVKRVEFGGEERTATVEDHGLESPVPRTDATANSGIDPSHLASETTSQLVTLARELRVRNTLFTSTSYLAGQITAYGAGDGWYDPDSDPLEDIENARDTMLVMPNTLTVGRDGLTALRSHPKLVKAARPASTGGEGRLSRDELRDLFEIDNIVVGSAVVNYAAPGQAATIQRAWDTHASLTFVEKILKNAQTYTFASTFRLGGKQAWSYFDEKVGLEGADVVRVGERLIEKVVAQRAGWFFQNAAKAPT